MKDLTTISTAQAVENADQRATAYEAGNQTTIQQQVAAYIDQIEKVLEVSGVNRMQWLKEVQGQISLRLHGFTPSPAEEREKQPLMSMQRRVDYFAAVHDEIKRLLGPDA